MLWGYYIIIQWPINEVIHVENLETFSLKYDCMCCASHFSPFHFQNLIEKLLLQPRSIATKYKSAEQLLTYFMSPNHQVKNTSVRNIISFAANYVFKSRAQNFSKIITPLHFSILTKNSGSGKHPLTSLISHSLTSLICV